MASGTFLQVPEQINFSQQEEKTLEYWKQIDAFKTSLKKSEGRPLYTFYDGPPFATGLPHYGHICAGTIKDVVCRYAHQTGHHVERRFGWDCHGLPVEYEIDKTYNINTKEDIQQMGIAKYNSLCKGIVMRYSQQWEEIVTRLGRWIDFKNDYKTLDLSFMESVWAVFKVIFDKNLVYRGARVMPYSTSCTTVLSNFEANLNYKDVSDPSIYIAFKSNSESDTRFVAWTTTPWTLTANLSLAVSPDMQYAKVLDKKTNLKFILLKELLEGFYKASGRQEGYEIESEFPGKNLEGMEYEPLFPYYQSYREKGCFRVRCANFITATEGTGIVHIAPSFGEEDFNLFVDLKNRGVVTNYDLPPDPLDANGKFHIEDPDIKGLYLKDADPIIKERLKREGKLLHSGAIVHSYPFCWRSNTPLIYRAQPSWFIKVEQIKQNLLVNNMKARWVPSFVQEKRFHNWLEQARDWCFSRNRCWGNPIPLWVSDDFEEVVCVGSIEELKRLTGANEITDLHREFIDHLTIPSQQGKGVLRRIEEVFDCWFESGSMPFAQSHWPFAFQSSEDFAKVFPADFIGEGLDQTRGWFYTLNVVATAVMDQNPFKNLIVNGLVLAEDGSKMSKSKKNFPDPMKVINEQGSDAIRLYLMNSPLVRAEPLKFSEKGVYQVVKEIFLPWYNAYRFLIQNCQRYEKKSGTNFQYDANTKFNCKNKMDIWITSSLQSLIQFTRNELENYRLYTVSPKLINFLNQLTNWYVRLNRPRLKGETNFEDQQQALNILFEAILDISLLMAPFTPFISEMFYQNMKRGIPQELEESIHYKMIPDPMKDLINPQIEEVVSVMQKTIEIGRNIRDKQKLALKQPVQNIVLIHHDAQLLEALQQFKEYIVLELNTENLEFRVETKQEVKLDAKPNFKSLGQRLQKDFTKELKQKLSKLSEEQILTFEKEGKLVIEGVQIDQEDLVITRSYVSKNPSLISMSDGQLIVVVNTELNENLVNQGNARELVNRVQKSRKTAGLNVEDPIVVCFVAANDQKSQTFLQQQLETLRNFLKVEVSTQVLEDKNLVSEGEFKNQDLTVNFKIYRV